MEYRPLGLTGIQISAISFGCGPVSGLMTGNDTDSQVAAVRRAVEVGINWFDTAPGYGNGRSETNLGRALRETSGEAVHVATKVRFLPEHLADALGHARRSLEESLARLGRTSVTLLQLHNGIATERGDGPNMLSPENVLRGGIAAAFDRLRGEGLTRHVGLTGTGDTAALGEVIRHGLFETIQLPYHLFDASPERLALMEWSRQANLGVLAIRVFAGGALLGAAPSTHTLTTPYFPLALYEQDRRRAAEVEASLRGKIAMPELAMRFVLDTAAVSSALIGFASPTQIDEALRMVGPMLRATSEPKA